MAKPINDLNKGHQPRPLNEGYQPVPKPTTAGYPHKVQGGYQAPGGGGKPAAPTTGSGVKPAPPATGEGKKE